METVSAKMVGEEKIVRNNSAKRIAIIMDCAKRVNVIVIQDFLGNTAKVQCA